MDCKNNGRSIGGITHWFMNCHFKVRNFWLLPFGILQPEVTIFGQKGGAGEG